MAIDTLRVEAAVAELLAAIGEDVGRPGLVQTPQRVAEAYSEFFSGVGVDPLTHLGEADGLADAGAESGELVLMRDLEFRSVCEHHLLPFIGRAHIAYVPGHRVVGLGKLARVLDTIASRPQLQERLTEQVADALDEGLAPLGVLVVLDAVHACVTTRGVRQPHSSTVTLATRGTLRDATERAGVLALIGAEA